MRFRIKNQSQETKEVAMLIIYIGDDRYRISEVSGSLCINKTSDGDTDMMFVNPRSGNEIHIS